MTKLWIFPLWGLYFMCCRWNFYQNTFVLKTLPSSEKFLIVHLNNMGFLQYINFTLILVHLPNQVSLLKRLLQRKTLCHQTQTKPQIFTRYFGGSCQRTLQVKLSNTCSIIIANNLSHVYKEDDDHELNHTDIYFDESLSFTISIYANLISSQHKIYSVYEKSVKYVTLTNLIKHLLTFSTCSGVTNENAKRKMCSFTFCSQKV